MSKIVIGISIFTVIVTLSVLYMLSRILTAIKLHTKETQKTVSVVKEVALPVEKIETTQEKTKEIQKEIVPKIAKEVVREVVSISTLSTSKYPSTVEVTPEPAVVAAIIAAIQCMGIRGKIVSIRPRVSERWKMAGRIENISNSQRF